MTELTQPTKYAMKVIPKGSCLLEVEPFMIVRLYDKVIMSKDISLDDSDPTHLSYMDELPGFQDCPVWKGVATMYNRNRIIDHTTSHRRTTTTYATSPKVRPVVELEKFLHRLHQEGRNDSQNSTTATGTTTWRILCVIAILNAVFRRLNQDDTQDNNNDKKAEESTKFLWGSINESTGGLLSNSDDDDDDDDDDLTLLIELWPLIQQYIPWTVCLGLYRTIQTQLHMVTLQHPLSKYAQETIFKLNENDFKQSCKVLYKLQQHNFEVSNTPPTHVPSSQSFSTTTTSHPPPLQRLHASHLWLDLVANLPPRIVGVLLIDPFSLPSPNRDYVPSNDDNDDDDNDHDQLPFFLPQHQSCLPNTCLELMVQPPKESDTNNSIDPPREMVTCTWMALYDLPCDDDRHQQQQKGDWTISTRPKLSFCECIQCQYEQQQQQQQYGAVRKGKTRKRKYHRRRRQKFAISLENLSQAQLLAHTYFQRECFEEAYAVYQECYTLCVGINDGGTDCRSEKSVVAATECSSSCTLPLPTKATAADLWHSMAAVLLSQRKFAQAQRHWKQGNGYKAYHKELSLQCEKQEAYQYFEPLTPVANAFLPSYENMRCRTGSISSTIPVFVAMDTIDNSMCDQLVEWAVDYAQDNGGWTTSRHYAVPTTDLPVHQVPRLLGWFQYWMPNVLFPLLQNQFGDATVTTTRCGRFRANRFYVHDAFLVRYEATAPNNFLPLHYDESTHSCVVALNDDFEGGGTYMYRLERSITPSKGAMVSFRGNKCLHGGNPVTNGVRYILAIFLYLDEVLSSDAEIDEPLQTISYEDRAMRPNDNHKSDVVDEAAATSQKRINNGIADEKKCFSFSFF
jgi:hypothetical protein